MNSVQEDTCTYEGGKDEDKVRDTQHTTCTYDDLILPPVAYVHFSTPDPLSIA